VAGGFDGIRDLASAEVYDPRSGGSWGFHGVSYGSYGSYGWDERYIIHGVYPSTNGGFVRFYGDFMVI
jgi:hypothetical protein